LVVLAGGGVQIGDLGLFTADGGEFLDVLGGLLLKNFKGVIVGEDA
jgi:hypothetical protein